MLLFATAPLMAAILGWIVLRETASDYLALAQMQVRPIAVIHELRIEWLLGAELLVYEQRRLAKKRKIQRFDRVFTIGATTLTTTVHRHIVCRNGEQANRARRFNNYGFRK